MSERSVSTLNKPDAALELTLRPSLFSEFTGQPKVKERLEIAVAAAKKRKEALDHVLLSGPPGLGKTTLANILAKAMGANLKSTSGPVVENTADIAGLLTNLEEGDVLFIDEIHRLPKAITECLCFSMASFQLDVQIDQGANARSVRLNLPRFTLIGATTQKERLANRFLTCFPIVAELDEYSIKDLTSIALRFANLLRFEIDSQAAAKIASSSDGTPLDVLNRLRHVRNYLQVRPLLESVPGENVEKALKLLPLHQKIDRPYSSRQGIPSEVRREVWRRDDGKCVKCGSRMNLEYDHIVPISKGGSNTARNIELLCESCNRSKGAFIE